MYSQYILRVIFRYFHDDCLLFQKAIIRNYQIGLQFLHIMVLFDFLKLYGMKKKKTDLFTTSERNYVGKKSSCSR